MDTKKIRDLLEAIRAKHNAACTFTIRAFGDQIDYQTYIDRDIWPTHRINATPEKAVQRLEDFLAVEDLSEYSSEHAAHKLRELRERRADLDDAIIQYEQVMEAHARRKGNATHPAKDACQAVQMSDQMVCSVCELAWDMNDPLPPECEHIRYL